MTDAQIDEAIDNLKTICDPRGHAVLDALRGVWKAHERILALVEDAPENGSHSRNADARLRLVR